MDDIQAMIPTPTLFSTMGPDTPSESFSTPFLGRSQWTTEMLGLAKLICHPELEGQAWEEAAGVRVLIGHRHQLLGQS